ncbi:hypothetical protein FRB94_004482, partial [Tulasnella sp. JGI-2019a]
MALTTHYIAERLDGVWELQSCLMAFKYIKGEHSGANLTVPFLETLKEAGVLHK